jgi:glutamyl-Q tRNA(Asp) synthetase
MITEPDQIVTIGAVAMQKNNKLFWIAARGRHDPRAVKFHCRVWHELSAWLSLFALQYLQSAYCRKMREGEDGVMQNVPPVFRFAPSPNGYLHLGHAFSALFTQGVARAFGGRMLLRIEDIDKTRARPEYEAAIYDDLAWLGLEWEEPVRRQSEHFSVYEQSLARLEALGLIYPCFASRAEIAQAVTDQGKRAARDPDGAPVYPGLYTDLPAKERAERIAAGEPYTLRLKMDEAIETAREKIGGPMIIRSIEPSGDAHSREAAPARWGDIVLARKDVRASYHLSVVTDDALQGVTHITRGMDLFAATDIHRLLQILLDLPEPVYCHHRLILDESGRKLSKSFRDKSLRALRKDGLTPTQIKEMVGFELD